MGLSGPLTSLASINMARMFKAMDALVRSSKLVTFHTRQQPEPPFLQLLLQPSQKMRLISDNSCAELLASPCSTEQGGPPLVPSSSLNILASLWNLMLRYRSFNLKQASSFSTKTVQYADRRLPVSRTLPGHACEQVDENKSKISLSLPARQWNIDFISIFHLGIHFDLHFVYIYVLFVLFSILWGYHFLHQVHPSRICWLCCHFPWASKSTLVTVSVPKQ